VISWVFKISALRSVCLGLPTESLLVLRIQHTVCWGFSTSICLYSTEEGGQRAFLRLQEEMLKRSDDLSILAWDNTKGCHYRGPLATSPAEFKDGATIVTIDSDSAPFETTNKGLRVYLPLIEIANGNGNVVAILHNCRYEDVFKGP
jgi:hypothetical protein